MKTDHRVAAYAKPMVLSIAVNCLMVASALACRGTVEFPQVALLLTEADLLPVEKVALAEKLEAAEALHRQGHELDSQEIRLESLAILDEIKATLAE